MSAQVIGVNETEVECRRCQARIRVERGGPPAPPRVIYLTPRAKEAADLVSRGLSNSTIACLMGLRGSQRVKNYVTEILNLVGADTRAALIYLVAERKIKFEVRERLRG